MFNRQCLVGVVGAGGKKRDERDLLVRLDSVDVPLLPSEPGRKPINFHVEYGDQKLGNGRSGPPKISINFNLDGHLGLRQLHHRMMKKIRFCCTHSLRSVPASCKPENHFLSSSSSMQIAGTVGKVHPLLVNLERLPD